MAGEITLDLTHRFESGVELRAVLERTIAPGAILVVFGPSGAGKTTLLRAIAGLLEPDRGRIAFDGRTWFDRAGGRFVPPQQRRVGYVAQETALFPHLTVRANIEYGLRAESVENRRRKASEAIVRVRIRDLEDRLPRQLSGGQAQRVALARALAPSPALLLLDEPFGALDVATRRELRGELRMLLQRTGTSAILVTHDRLEAMAMGDSLAVMIDGAIRQVGPVSDVFRRPADPVVARALGIETVLPAIVDAATEGLVTLRVGSTPIVAVADTSYAIGDEVFVCLRAEDVIVERRGSGGDSVRNRLNGVVVKIEREGAVDRLTIDCGFEVIAAITSRSREELALAEGAAVVAAIKATAVHLVRRDG